MSQFLASGDSEFKIRISSNTFIKLRSIIRLKPSFLAVRAMATSLSEIKAKQKKGWDAAAPGYVAFRMSEGGFNR